jgi:hypothetical protein
VVFWHEVMGLERRSGLDCKAVEMHDSWEIQHGKKSMGFRDLLNREGRMLLFE